MTSPVGSFRVRAEAEEARAFRAAIGASATDDATLPLTFPMRWMVLPEVRLALADLLPEPGTIPVHESQSFDYEQPLRRGVDYVLDLTARRETVLDRLVVEGTIVDGDGNACARVETVLRLFSMDAAAP